MASIIYAPVLWSYGASAASAGLKVLYEISETYVGSYTRLYGHQIANEDSIKKRFWAWTRWPEYGVWALTTVGIINEDGTMGIPIGSWDAVSTWSTAPRIGEDEKGNWWLLQLLQAPRLPDESTSATKPITGTVTWRESACTGSVTSIVSYASEAHSWFGVNIAVSGTITDAVTEEVVGLNYTRYNTYTEPLASSPTDFGPWVVSVEVDWSSEASTSELSLGGDDIKTWDYYTT